MYKILWIDDEHEGQHGLFRNARQASIELIPFKSYKSGIEELEKNYQFFDGLLLDAQILENDSDDPKTADTKFVHRLKERILMLPKKFEIFVLTGQSSAYGSDEFSNAFPNIYKKGVERDVENLFLRLKKSADMQIDTQIRHEHTRIFEILENYEPQSSKHILDILCSVRNKVTFFDDSLYFTQLRIILESMFRKANEIGLLHDAIISRGDERVNLTDASLFLAGQDTRHCEVRCKKVHFPKIIADNVKNFLFITGGASHTSNVDLTKHIDVQNYRITMNTPYLLYCLTFILFDVLIWFDEYSKHNSDYAKNVSQWEDISYDSNGKKWVSGKITKLNTSNWATIVINNTGEEIGIPPQLVASNSLMINDSISVIIDEKLRIKNLKKTV